MKHIVILGAGFGGLKVARELSKKLTRANLLDRYSIILVDQNDHHTYTPLLYEVATTSKETADIHSLHEIAAYPLRSILDGWPITFYQNKVTKIDPLRAEITLGANEKINYDYLVLTLGSETNYFDIPGLAKYGLPLKTFADAIRIRDTIWNLALNQVQDIRISVGGAGPTGVELAGELKVWCGQLEQQFGKCRLNVTLIQGKPTILYGFHPKVIRRTENRLKSLGVQIIPNARVTKVLPKETTLADGKKIPHDIFAWTGGTHAPELVSGLPFKLEPQGLIQVLGQMECIPTNPNLTIRKKVYALGDTTCFHNPKTNAPVPGVARAALSQATVAAHNILEDIQVEEQKNTSPHYKEYHPIEYPYIVPAGGKFAVAKVGPLIVGGLMGWLFKGIVELNYILSIMSPRHALRIWLKGLKVFIQNDRLG